MKHQLHILKIALIVAFIFTGRLYGYSAEPSWSSGYPQVLSGASSADIKVKTDTAGTVYYCLYSSIQNGITATQLKDQALNGGNAALVRRGSLAVTSNAEHTIALTSLADNRTYHIYIVAESGGILMSDAKISYTARLFPKRQREFTTLTNNIICGHLTYLPENYYKDNRNYPLLVFLHGAGEMSKSNTPNFTRLRSTALPYLIENGREVPMIVASPQAKYNWEHTEAAVDAFLEYLKTTYRVDEDQIFFTGLSNGGKGLFQYVDAHPEKVKAIVAVSTLPEATTSISDFVPIPVWAFMGADDPNGHANMINFINNLNAAGGDGTYTTYPGEHGIWNDVYSGVRGDDVYTWLLSQSTPQNDAPVVHAGTDQQFILPRAEIVLAGSVSDTDGTIASIQWTKISGPSVTMSNTTTATVTLTDITAGTYTFSLTAQDNAGATASDQVVITVNPSTTGSKIFQVNLTWNTNKQGGNWNDFITTNGGTAGTTLTLFDSDNDPSNLKLTITADFQSGNNNHGVVPGIYPDNVMKYYLRSTQTKTGALKLSGLDATKVYDFSLLSSNVDVWYPSDTRFTIAGQSATINGKGNATGLVTINNITPDASGEVTIIVAPATTNTANHGIINAMIITERPLSSNSSGRTGTTTTDLQREAETAQAVSVFPNPVEDYIYIEVNPSALHEEALSVEFLDIRGTRIHNIQLQHKSRSNKYIEKIKSDFMTTGIYIMRVQSAARNIQQLKIVKR